MINLDDTHIFIAGGSRGIGRAVALMAGQAGAKVSVNYVSNDAAAHSLATEITEGGGSAPVLCKGDISTPGVAADCLELACERQGPLHGLVVTAGIFEAAPITEMTAEFWDRTMAINVRGSFLAVQAAVPHMREAGGGSIVIYSSTAGQRGSALFSAYASSKAAQIMFMRSMALELAPEIRCNCIAPAWTETDMAREAMNAEGRDQIIAGFPLGRIGLPDDCAGATCFLLSDLARFITGSTVTVDGGMDMRG